MILTTLHAPLRSFATSNRALEQPKTPTGDGGVSELEGEVKD
jgi:hypothetical protein